MQLQMTLPNDRPVIDLIAVVDHSIQSGDIDNTSDLLRQCVDYRLGYRAFNYLENRLTFKLSK